MIKIKITNKDNKKDSVSLGGLNRTFCLRKVASGLLSVGLCFAIYPTFADSEDLQESIHTKEPAKYLINHISIQIHPIFNEQEATGWLYKTANQLHIDSKPYVIKHLLPFKVGDSISERGLQEAERILRNQKFLREAEIGQQLNADGSVDLTVDTWETWTLWPTVDVRREGGVTEYSYGIKDSNLLGLGIDAEIGYFKEADRTGSTLSLGSQISEQNHIWGNLILSDNSDGEQYGLTINKPFYTLDEHWSGGLSINSQRQIDSIYNNDEKVNNFEHDQEYLNVSGGYSEGLVNDQVVRYWAGITRQKDRFSAADLTIALPQQRDFLYPWLGISYQQDQFIKTKNLYLIGRTEDIQLGWRYFFKVGKNTASGIYSGAWLWDGWSRYGQQIGEHQFVNFFTRIHGVTGASQANTSYYYDALYEHFYHASESRIWYGKLRYWGAQNPYLDQPISIGGEQGLRGYPIEYQHGKRSFLLSLEKRYYPGIELFKMADLGFAAFVDAGQASGDTIYLDQEDGVLASAGVGLRFFLSRSSGQSIVNVDFAVPLNSEHLSGLEVSVKISGSF